MEEDSSDLFLELVTCYLCYLLLAIPIFPVSFLISRLARRSAKKMAFALRERLVHFLVAGQAARAASKESVASVRTFDDFFLNSTAEF